MTCRTQALRKSCMNCSSLSLLFADWSELYEHNAAFKKLCYRIRYHDGSKHKETCERWKIRSAKLNTRGKYQLSLQK